MWSRSTIALAYASALILAERYDQAAQLLDDPIITDDTQAAQWHQFVAACLYFKTRRWPDCPRCHRGIAAGARDLHRARSHCGGHRAVGAAPPPVLAGSQEALKLLDTIHTTNPLLAADVALTRGWCLRELGDEDGAAAAFQACVVDGQLLPAAREAIGNPRLRLIVTDAETIATRTDKWDPATETSREQRDAAALADEQQAVLAKAQARLDELIGLEGPKEQIAVWRTEIQIDQLLAAQGEGNLDHQRKPHGAGRPAGHRQDHVRAHRRRNPVRAGQDPAPGGQGSRPRRTSSSGTCPRPPNA